MPIFKDADEVYAHLGKLFEDLAVDPELAPRLQEADTILQFRFRRPDALVTIKMLAGEELQVDVGVTPLRPEVVLSMDADTGHGFWLGKVNVTVALARGHVHARGPVAKILKVVPLVKPIFPRYREQLHAAGRDDLADAA